MNDSIPSPTSKKRIDGRRPNQLRSCVFHRDFLHNAKGSVLVEQGGTRVLCAVSVTPGVPRWMTEQGVAGGWVTSEYQMLPASTSPRSVRDVTRGSVNGRAQEIQRLIGRSLRAVVDLEKIGANTVHVDCDVLDADGGTRCASINGALVALDIAFRKLLAEGVISAMPIREFAAAVSVGMVKCTAMLDLCYEEDAAAEADVNVVMTATGQFIEIQGTGEGTTFSPDQMQTMLDLARHGILEIIALQKQTTGVQ